jgi:N-acetylmuramoyl-L-alanine amidase
MSKKIFVDAGHGIPKDSGAVGNGLKEAEVVLKIQEQFVAHLKANYTGFSLNYTRTDNKTFLSLSERARKANAWGADVFVSFHNNSATATAHGYEDFIYQTKPAGSKNLQDALHAKVLPVLKKHGITDRGKKAANYAVLRETNMSAILTETLFISNAKEAALLKNASVLKEFGAAYADGVAAYLGLAKKTASKPSSPTINKGDKSIGTIKTLVDDLWYYDKADWNAKKAKLPKGTVLTIAKELTVNGSKMYETISGTFITAYPKYVQFTKK